jgi:hypothetical protein
MIAMPRLINGFVALTAATRGAHNYLHQDAEIMKLIFRDLMSVLTLGTETIE